MIIEAYLDSNNEYYDYRTADYTGGTDIFDETKTGVSYYQDFLDCPEYMLKRHNLAGKVIMLSPTEYFQECASKIFSRSDLRMLKASRERDFQTLKHLQNVLDVYHRKLCVPYINYASKQQEGLHRMLFAGNTFGWDTKFPVLVVDYADKDRQQQIEQEKQQAYIDDKISSAIHKTLQYQFIDSEDLADQLGWEIDRVFRYDDELDAPDSVTLRETPEQFTFVFLGNTYSIDKSDIRWSNSTEVDDTLDDFLTEDYTSGITIDDQLVADVIEDSKHTEFLSTDEPLESICNKLYQEHNIDARYSGRSVFLGDIKIATVKLTKNSPTSYIVTDYTVYL